MTGVWLVKCLAPLLAGATLVRGAVAVSDAGRSTFVQQNLRADDGRMELNVVKHQPCARAYHDQYNVQAPHELIVFPHSDKAPVVEDTRNKGCYYIKGDVAVLRDVTTDLELYAELRYSPDQNETPERCFDPDPDTGCGGYGSCVYCDGCKTVRKQEVRQVARIQIIQSDRTLACNSRVEKGYHRDIAIYFCMPPERDFIRNLKQQGFTKDNLQTIMASRGWNAEKLGIFMHMYIFDQSVRQNVTDQRFLEQVVTQDWTLGLPEDVVTKMPMYQLVKRNPPAYIGCHQIYGTLKLDLNSADWTHDSVDVDKTKANVDMADRRHEFFLQKRRESTLTALRQQGFTSRLVSRLRALDARAAVLTAASRRRHRT